MAEFVCKIGTDAGRVTVQTEEARSEEELRQRLRAQGFLIFSIRPKDILSFQVRRSRPANVRPDDFLIFNQQFLTLSKSGLPLQKSLDLLAHQTRSEALRAALVVVRDKVRSGALLSEAFESTGSFPKIYSATVRAGERSGSLDKVLAHYVTYQKQSRGFRKKFVSALIYPAVLMIVLTILVTLVIEFIVPQFAKLYADMDVQLPAMTTFTISFAMQVKHFFLLIILGIAGLVFLAKTAARSEQTRMAWERVKFRIPLVGNLLLKFSVAEFARTLSTLLQGGTPIIAALETAKDSVSSPWLSQAIAQARAEVAAGKDLSGSLRASGFFPSIAIDMMEVGETTGAMSNMLEALAEFFEEDVSIDLETRLALVGPIMIAIIAVIVAFVLIAFYLPLFSMASMIH
ncbi:MAG: type II secretion system F family protein [Acidobacteriota bacterium]|nr:type II secretion system F family protein [Acidobacteriota bacterium]